MTTYEPKHRSLDSKSGKVYFYTCARPGRSTGQTKPVSDTVVSAWVRSLTGPNIAIVSLLGRKQGTNGKSEFSFYSFCGGFDTLYERKEKVSFQEWLNKWHSDLEIEVFEHPTYDVGRIPKETLEGVASDVFALIAAGKTVYVMDSGGVDRTGMVFGYLKQIWKVQGDSLAKREA